MDYHDPVKPRHHSKLLRQRIGVYKGSKLIAIVFGNHESVHDRALVVERALNWQAAELRGEVGAYETVECKHEPSPAYPPSPPTSWGVYKPSPDAPMVASYAKTAVADRSDADVDQCAAEDGPITPRVQGRPPELGMGYVSAWPQASTEASTVATYYLDPRRYSSKRLAELHDVFVGSLDMPLTADRVAQMHRFDPCWLAELVAETLRKGKITLADLERIDVKTPVVSAVATFTPQTFWKLLQTRAAREGLL